MKRSLIALTILTVSSCNLFDKNERLLAEHLKTNGEKINVYYVALGATTNDVIQVRKSNQDSIIWASDKYNHLKDSKLINDTILQMVLSDTGFYIKSTKPDTLNIRIK
jgi:predicted Rdx family selenoprotein